MVVPLHEVGEGAQRRCRWRCSVSVTSSAARWCRTCACRLRACRPMSKRAALASADYVIADADHAGTLDTVLGADRVADTVFIGSLAPDGALAWMMRPIDPLQVIREIDAAVALRQAQAQDDMAPPAAPRRPRSRAGGRTGVRTRSRRTAPAASTPQSAATPRPRAGGRPAATGRAAAARGRSAAVPATPARPPPPCWSTTARSRCASSSASCRPSACAPTPQPPASGRSNCWRSTATTWSSSTSTWARRASSTAWRCASGSRTSTGRRPRPRRRWW